MFVAVQECPLRLEIDFGYFMKTRFINNEGIVSFLRTTAMKLCCSWLIWQCHHEMRNLCLCRLEVEYKPQKTVSYSMLSAQQFTGNSTLTMNTSALILILGCL